MQFELSFEDGKSEHFGDGFERNVSSSTGRYIALVLIATLAAILLWLIGTAAGARGRAIGGTPVAVYIAHTRAGSWLGRCCSRSRAGRPPQA
jgi:hypothetical protein